MAKFNVDFEFICRLQTYSAPVESKNIIIIVEMARKNCNNSKWFILILLVFCMTYSGEGLESNKTIRTSPDFNSLISQNNIISLKEINEFSIKSSPLNAVDKRCLSELRAIGNGIQNSELWAMKSKVDFFS